MYPGDLTMLKNADVSREVLFFFLAVYMPTILAKSKIDILVFSATQNFKFKEFDNLTHLLQMARNRFLNAPRYFIV